MSDLRKRLIKKMRMMVRRDQITKPALCMIFDMFCKEKDKYSKNKSQHFFILNNFSDDTVQKVYDYLVVIETMHERQNHLHTPSFKNSGPITNQMQQQSQLNILQLVQNRPNIPARPKAECCSTSISDLRIKIGSEKSNFYVQVKQRPQPNTSGTIDESVADATSGAVEETISDIVDKSSLKNIQVQMGPADGSFDQVEELIQEKQNVLEQLDPQLVDHFSIKLLPRPIVKKIMESKRSASSTIRGAHKTLLNQTGKLHSKPIHYSFKTANSIFPGPIYNDMELDVDVEYDIDDTNDIDDDDDADIDDDDAAQTEWEETVGDDDCKNNEYDPDFDDQSDFSDDDDEVVSPTTQRLKRLSERYATKK